MLQERFVVERTGSVPLDEEWHVALTMTSQFDSEFNDTSVKAWLTGRELRMPLQAADDQWVIFNVQQVGKIKIRPY